MKFYSVALAALLPIVVSAVDIPVAVGQNGLTFEPSSVTAREGDVIVFTFYPKNHTVTESNFATPCTKDVDDDAGQPDADADDIVPDSGFIPVDSVDALRSWNYTVTDSDDSVWFYCAQTQPVNHCTSGMVFAVNPTAERTFAAFQANARAATPGSAPGGSPTGNTGAPGGTGGSGTTSGTAPGSTNTGNQGGSGNGNGASSLMLSTGVAAIAVAGAFLGAAL